MSADLFNAIVDVAHTSRFLPYDKDRRWFRNKVERAMVQEIIHTADRTVIPTLTDSGRRLIKIHYYASMPPDAAEVTDWAHRWCATHGAASSRLLWFQHAPHGARGRLMLKTFSDQDTSNASRITQLRDCDAADSFDAFARQLGDEGFAFLDRRLRAGHKDGPILVTTENKRIVGAIGPMSTLIDANGSTMQPPQYFAVHPDYRQKGHGRALWRAAMAWGRDHGAEYKVLQAASGSPAERLYLSEGLTTLGFICTQDLASTTIA
ncbi:GNAT family N-acetyltransferase [Sphaerisporangium sp. NPDC051017]|uniref:GNAT family N-acetyltransferase n=1 Tax=Sphaerisporangium sp. NPDC051017 TaxID=3154636 RepID=UPI00341E08FF